MWFYPGLTTIQVTHKGFSGKPPLMRLTSDAVANSLRPNVDSRRAAKVATTVGPGLEQPKQVTSSIVTYRNHTHTSRPSAGLSPFQRLPPEIRWQIYQDLFYPHRVEILRCKDKSPDPSRPARYRLYHRQLQPRDTQSQDIRPSTGRRSYPPLPLALIFTCRLMYCETILLFYSTMQFVFISTKSAARFLKITDKDAQSAIRHVELNHVMYNEPRLTEFRVYKFRSDMAWYLVCDDMAQALVSLSVLHVHMTVYDWPIHLEVGERWSFPLLVFGQYGDQLDYAKIRLRMPRFSEEKLRFVARDLEQKIMKPQRFQIREDERLARKLMGSVKAKKILKVVF
ncbi:hypothetical protein EYZ11_008963 [Aspergillus tanneri]|nr:hypothetical protein EYZ11_008963 [Aspergillus tanneri]